MCDGLYRHETHTQALMPMNCDAIMAVACGGSHFTEPADLDRSACSDVRPQDALVLNQGTWHWGPFPIGRDAVQLLNVQGLRYAEDNEHAPSLGVSVSAVVEVVA